MVKRLAMTTDGRMTYCSAPEGTEGTHGCNHVLHLKEGESSTKFSERATNYHKKKTIMEHYDKNLPFFSVSEDEIQIDKNFGEFHFEEVNHAITHLDDITPDREEYEVFQQHMTDYDGAFERSKVIQYRDKDNNLIKEKFVLNNMATHEDPDFQGGDYFSYEKFVNGVEDTSVGYEGFLPATCYEDNFWDKDREDYDDEFERSFKNYDKFIKDIEKSKPVPKLIIGEDHPDLYGQRRYG